MRGAPWGGSEPLWSGAAELALEEGHQVAVSVFDWPERAQKIEDLERRGAQLILRPLSPSRFTSWIVRPSWLREVDLFRAEAICLSQGSAFECVGRRSTRPIERWLTQSDVPVVNVLQYNADTTLKPAIRAAAHRLFARARVNAFVAQRNIEQAARTMGAAIPRACVLRNPVNLPDARPLALPDNTELRLACVARLDCRIKGQDTLIDVLAEPRWRDRPWRLSLMGSGPDESSLRERVRARWLESRVTFHGQVADMRSLWADHHALVLASKAEGTPLSMVEAMLLGRPCVVPDVGGCTEWVREGQEGFVAATPAEQALSDALDRLFTVRNRLPEFGARARSRALDLHDPSPARTLLNLVTSAVC